VLQGMDALKDGSSHLLDQWWMWSAIFTDLLTRWVAKPYLLSSSIVTTLCCNLLPWPTILKAFDGWLLRVMWAMHKRSLLILWQVH
jgi:hypothetical protein